MPSLFSARKGENMSLILSYTPAAVMGVSPFHTKRDLYYDKKGIRPVMDEEEDNWVAKEVGHRLEDLVLESIRRHCGPAEKDVDQVKLDRK